MPNENDDETRKPPPNRPHLGLVKETAPSKSEPKKAESSKEQERVLGLLFHLRASRSLINAYESAESIFLRLDSTLDYMKNRIHDSQLTRKMMVQINLAVALESDIQEAMQTVADFAGEDFLELVQAILLGSKYVRRKGTQVEGN